MPEHIPVSVFPLDPDNSFRRGRQWETSAHSFSPILEQRWVRGGSPLITFEVGFGVMKGELTDGTTRAGKLWQFFNDHRGRAVAFWYFDVVPWSTMPLPYRDNPASRLSHPTQASLGRYIALFNEDDMGLELFEFKLRKSQLKISGYPG